MSFHNAKGPINHKDIITVNLYGPVTGAPKYMKQRLQKGTSKAILTARNIGVPFSVDDRPSSQKNQ